MPRDIRRRTIVLMQVKRVGCYRPTRTIGVCKAQGVKAENVEVLGEPRVGIENYLILLVYALGKILEEGTEIRVVVREIRRVGIDLGKLVHAWECR